MRLAILVDNAKDNHISIVEQDFMSTYFLFIFLTTLLEVLFYYERNSYTCMA